LDYDVLDGWGDHELSQMNAEESFSHLSVFLFEFILIKMCLYHQKDMNCISTLDAKKHSYLIVKIGAF